VPSPAPDAPLDGVEKRHDEGHHDPRQQRASEPLVPGVPAAGRDRRGRDCSLVRSLPPVAGQRGVREAASLPSAAPRPHARGVPMSWRDLVVVLQRSPARGPALLVLLALANRCNGRTGRCDPSGRRIAADTGLHRRTVERAIRQLEAHRLLEVTRRHRHRNRYRLLLAELTLGGRAPPSTRKGTSEGTGAPAARDYGGGRRPRHGPQRVGGREGTEPGDACLARPHARYGQGRPRPQPGELGRCAGGAAPSSDRREAWAMSRRVPSTPRAGDWVAPCAAARPPRDDRPVTRAGMARTIRAVAPAAAPVLRAALLAVANDLERRVARPVTTALGPLGIVVRAVLERELGAMTTRENGTQ